MVYNASWSLENHAPSSPSRCPASVVGTNPSSGFKLHIRAVRSFAADRKKRESLDHSILWTVSWWPACRWCSTKGAKSRPSSSSAPGVEGVCHTSISLPIPTAKWRPEGENAKAETRRLKEKWCRGSLRGKLVRMAWPSSSTVRSRFPRGLRARQEILRRWEKGRVSDSFLRALAVVFSGIRQSCHAYLTKSNTEILLPTGDRRQWPFGVKSKFPWE